MTVYIYEKNAFEKMVKVEGEEYVKNRGKGKEDIFSFSAFLEEWNEKFKPNSNVVNSESREAIRVGGNAAIYGLGGWNRYFVYSDGEIVFSKSHSVPKGIEKAAQAGFNLD